MPWAGSRSIPNQRCGLTNAVRLAQTFKVCVVSLRDTEPQALKVCASLIAVLFRNRSTDVGLRKRIDLFGRCPARVELVLYQGMALSLASAVPGEGLPPPAF